MFDEITALTRRVEALEALAEDEKHRVHRLFATFCVILIEMSVDLPKILRRIDGSPDIPHTNEFIEELRAIVREAEKSGNQPDTETRHER